jgi:hypothetical protein
VHVLISLFAVVLKDWNNTLDSDNMWELEQYYLCLRKPQSQLLRINEKQSVVFNIGPALELD